jgi:membrane protein DedA with SNARE-associated domain
MAVLVGRLFPTIRTLISVPAGVACMPPLAFTFWTSIGTAIWTAILTLLGYVLQSQYTRVADWLDPVATAIVVGLVAIYVYRVVTYTPSPESAR